MIKNLGDLGTYQEKNSKHLVLLSPGRKYNSKKESDLSPGEFYWNELKPEDARLGDIIDRDYRKTESYIVSLDSKKKLILVELPEDGSGYGIIPLSVSIYFKNAINTFKDKEDIKYIELSPNDLGLKQYFFKDNKIPKKYHYKYWITGDELIITDPLTNKTLELTQERAKLLNGKINEFIKHFFNKRPKENLQISVTVNFSNERKSELQQLNQQSQNDDELYEKYQELKKQYNQQKRQFEKSKATKLEKLLLDKNVVGTHKGGSGNTTHFILHGTKRSLNQVEKEIKELNQKTKNFIYQIKKK